MLNRLRLFIYLDFSCNILSQEPFGSQVHRHSIALSRMGNYVMHTV